MNFVRTTITRGFAVLSIPTVSCSASVRGLTKASGAASHYLRPVTYIQILGVRNYALSKQKPLTEPEESRPSSALEAKIQQLEEAGALSTPPGANAQRLKTTPPVPKIIQKRSHRKKRDYLNEFSTQGFYNVTAYATAEEYDLETLHDALEAQNLYATKKFFSTDTLGAEQDVLYVTAKYKVGMEPRDIYFFREGAVVLWNCNEIEANNVLAFLRPHEKDAYVPQLVRGESEMMPYTYIPESALDIEGDLVADVNIAMTRAFFHNGKFFLTMSEDNFLQKYTFSNALATSIKLGIWEATLDRYIDSMEYLTEDLKKGRRIRISRAQVLRKTGELFALRHVINLSSDLLDTPDFYWDREELEALYLQVCSYFSISRRTKVMNEKINHCVELAELISHNLNDAHHIRLEWMIIVLIMVEVGFEIVHYMDRFYSDETTEALNQPATH